MFHLRSFPNRDTSRLVYAALWPKSGWRLWTTVIGQQGSGPCPRDPEAPVRSQGAQGKDQQATWKEAAGQTSSKNQGQDGKKPRDGQHWQQRGTEAANRGIQERKSLMQSRQEEGGETAVPEERIPGCHQLKQMPSCKVLPDQVGMELLTICRAPSPVKQHEEF